MSPSYTSQEEFQSCSEGEDESKREKSQDQMPKATDSTDTLLIDNELVRSLDSFEGEILLETDKTSTDLPESKVIRAASTEAVPPDSSRESSDSAYTPRSDPFNIRTQEDVSQSSQLVSTTESPRSFSSSDPSTSTSQMTTIVTPFARKTSPQNVPPRAENPPGSSSPTPTNSPRMGFSFLPDSPTHSADSTPCQSPRHDRTPFDLKSPDSGKTHQDSSLQSALTESEIELLENLSAPTPSLQCSPQPEPTDHPQESNPKHEASDQSQDSIPVSRATNKTPKQIEDLKVITPSHQKQRASPSYDVSYDYVEYRIKEKDNKEQISETKPDIAHKPNLGQSIDETKPDSTITSKQNPGSDSKYSRKSGFTYRPGREGVQHSRDIVKTDPKRTHGEKSIGTVIGMAQPLEISSDEVASNDSSALKPHGQPTAIPRLSTNTSTRIPQRNRSYESGRKPQGTKSKDSVRMTARARAEGRKAGDQDSSPDDPPPLPLRLPESQKPRSPRSPRAPPQDTSENTSPRSVEYNRSRSHSPHSGKNKYTFTTSKLVAENYQVKRNQRYRSASAESLDSDRFTDAPLEQSESDPFLLDDNKGDKSPSSRFGGSQPSIPAAGQNKSAFGAPLVYPAKKNRADYNTKGLNVDPYREAYSANNNPVNTLPTTQPFTYQKSMQNGHPPQLKAGSVPQSVSRSHSGLANNHDWPSSNRNRNGNRTSSGMFYMGPDTMNQNNGVLPSQWNKPQDGSQFSERENQGNSPIDLSQYRLIRNGDQIDLAQVKDPPHWTQSNGTMPVQEQPNWGKAPNQSDMTPSAYQQLRKSMDDLNTPSQEDKIMMRYLSKGRDRSVTALATSTALARKEMEQTKRQEQSMVSAVASAEATGDNPYIVVARATARVASIASASAAREASVTGK